MYVKTIKYKDFDDKEREEDFLFNLTAAEVVEWLSTNSEVTLDKIMANMSKKSDVKGIFDSTKDLIYRAYGEKSVDGRRFVKTPEIKANFMESNAYSVLFMELLTDAKAMADFIGGIIPADLEKQVEEIQKNNPDIKAIS